jgi:RimJ/RimL family protein N-acetyltransferase
MLLVNDITLLTTIFDNYKKSKFFFPLIGAVLEGKQSGNVYVDNEKYPETILVVHKFLFAQIISENPTKEVWEKVCSVIDSGTDFNGDDYNKIRFYCANDGFIDYLNKINKYNCQVGERARFFPSENWVFEKINDSVIEIEDVDLINEQHHLDLGNRFWNSNRDFLQNSNPFYVKDLNIIKSVCYAAAVSDNKAEIDVATHDNYRKMGYAKEAVKGFVETCGKNNIVPLWDCYVNNIPSMNTAKSIGFKEHFRYQFLILNNS